MSIYGDSGLGDVAKSIELKLMHFVDAFVQGDLNVNQGTRDLSS